MQGLKIKTRETITVKLANSYLYFLWRSAYQVNYLWKSARCTLMRSKWQKWWKETLSCPHFITMHVFYWRWMLWGGCCCKCLDCTDTIHSRNERKEILLASQHKRGRFLIEWRGCFVLLLLWKSSARRKAVHALQKRERNTERSSGKLFHRNVPQHTACPNTQNPFSFSMAEHKEATCCDRTVHID